MKKLLNYADDLLHLTRNAITIVLLISFLSGICFAQNVNKDYVQQSDKGKQFLAELKKIQSLKSEIKSLEIEYANSVEKYKNTKNGGFLGFFNPKNKAQEDMERAKNVLKSVKRALNNSEAQLKKILSNINNNKTKGPKYNANRDVHCLREALECINFIVVWQGGQLKNDPKNARKALEYYSLYCEMLSYLESMHIGFIGRAEGKYYTYLRNQWGNWLIHKRNMENELPSISSKKSQAMLKRKINEANRIANDVMPNALKKLNEMKTWARTNLKNLREKQKVAGIMQRHAGVTTEIESINEAVEIEFLNLDYQEPPLQEFTIDIDMLK